MKRVPILLCSCIVITLHTAEHTVPSFFTRLCCCCKSITMHTAEPTAPSHVTPPSSMKKKDERHAEAAELSPLVTIPPNLTIATIAEPTVPSPVTPSSSTEKDEEYAEAAELSPSVTIHSTLTVETIIEEYNRSNSWAPMTFSKEPRIAKSRSIILNLIYVNCPEYPKEKIECFLQAGVPIDQKNQNGITALMELSHGVFEKGRSHLSFTQGLLEHNADPTVQDDKGQNALVHALECSEGNRHFAYLLRHPKVKAIINTPLQTARDPQGKTLLSRFLRRTDFWRTCGTNSKTVQALYNAGARIMPEDKEFILKQDGLLMTFQPFYASDFPLPQEEADATALLTTTDQKGSQ